MRLSGAVWIQLEQRPRKISELAKCALSFQKLKVRLDIVLRTNHPGIERADERIIAELCLE